MKAVSIDSKFLEFPKINVEHLESGVSITAKDRETSVFCTCVYVYYCSLHSHDANTSLVFQDAADLCIAILKKKIREQVFMGCDNTPVTRSVTIKCRMLPGLATLSARWLCS